MKINKRKKFFHHILADKSSIYYIIVTFKGILFRQIYVRRIIYL